MSEMRFVRAQDRQLSLWQSAVSENIRGRLGINAAPATTVQVTMDPMMEAVHQHVETALVGNPPTAPAPDSNDDSEVLPYLSRLGFELGQALAEEDAERAAAIEAEARKYSDQDPGFLTCATTYAAYYAAYRGVFAYADWRKEGGGNINYGVIDWRLPNDARVGIIGDWGTGLDDAKELLRDLIHQHKPAALIHLGDIYYSATPTECQVNYADVITQVFDEELGEGNRIPVFTLAGNHDYYALGYDFYRTFGTMNSDIPGADQVASYFCLRSADGGWQFVAMDTGYYDSNPADQVNPLYAGPWLHDSEVPWLQHKVGSFAGVTVLLSHHQLYSANAKLNGMASPYKDLPYLNPYLHKAFEQYFSTKVAAWLWGHEHNFVAYRNGIFGLAKGRLVGCSAYEEAESSDPYKVNYGQVPYLDPSKYRLKADEGYYNHGYAVIDLSKRAQPTDPISIEYYQYPSWGATRPPSPQSSQFFSETFARPTPPPPELATYNTSLNLYAEEGLYVGPLYQQTQYYPTLTTEGPVGLEVIGGTGAIRHGDQVSIKTLEGAAGSDNVLGAWSTPTLYYYRPGWDQQIWTIVKRDASDPLIHYGDQVSFVNKSYSGQYLQPYWSKVYGAVYLTTQSGDPYYWSMRPAMQSFEPVPMLDAAAVPG